MIAFVDRAGQQRHTVGAGNIEADGQHIGASGPDDLGDVGRRVGGATTPASIIRRV